jgi:hypothetical protein
MKMELQNPAPDFNAFFRNELRFYYEAAAALRTTAALQMTKVFASITILTLINLLTPKKANSGILVLWALGAAVIYWIWTSPKFKKREYQAQLPQVQEEAMNRLVKFINPDWRYFVSAPQMDDDFRNSGLFPIKLDYIHEKHCIAGSVDGQPMAAVGIHAGVYKDDTVYENGKKRRVRTAKAVFNGFFLAVEFPKKFEGWVTVQRDHYEKKLGWLASEFRKLSDSQVIHLENKEFEKIFKVRGSNAVTAHYLLSSTMMEQLLKLHSCLPDIPFELCFRDSALYVTLPMPLSFFEPSGNEDDWRSSATRDASQVWLLMDVLSRLGVEKPAWDQMKEAS